MQSRTEPEPRWRFFIIIESIDLEEMNNKKNLRISIRTKIEANWSFNYYYNWLCLELKKK